MVAHNATKPVTVVIQPAHSPQYNVCYNVTVETYCRLLGNNIVRSLNIQTLAR